MKVHLKSISLANGTSFKDFKPARPDDFHVTLRLTIGKDVAIRESHHSLYICTPNWLAQETQAKGPVTARHTLIVSHFEPAQITASIQQLIDQCQRPAWADTLSALTHFFAA